MDENRDNSLRIAASDKWTDSVLIYPANRLDPEHVRLAFALKGNYASIPLKFLMPGTEVLRLRAWYFELAADAHQIGNAITPVVVLTKMAIQHQRRLNLRR